MKNEGNVKITKLKPCPFCGSGAKLRDASSRFGVMFYVSCKLCGCRLPSQNTESLAIYEWNRRAENEQ